MPETVARAQTDAAYERMSGEAHYRPGGGDDRVGAPAPESTAALEDEQDWFFRQWWTEEEMGSYHLGVPTQADRPAMIYALWAVRALNGEGSRETAAALLRMALEEIE